MSSQLRRAVFEFDTHEVVVCEQWIWMDGHRAVHLNRPFQTAFYHPQGVIVDGTLFAYLDLLRCIRSSADDSDGL